MVVESQMHIAAEDAVAENQTMVPVAEVEPSMVVAVAAVVVAAEKQVGQLLSLVTFSASC